MILSVTLNPCVDLTLFVDTLKPFDTNRISRKEVDAGGKGINLSRVAVELGAKSLATGFIGGPVGDQVLAVMRDQGVVDAMVRTRAETRMNFSVEDGTENPPTTFNAKGGPFDSSEWTALVNKVSELSREAKWVAIGGSLPLGVPADAYKTLVEVAKNQGARVLLDADGEPLKAGLLGAPDMIKPNLPEASRLLGRPLQTREEAIDAVQEIWQMLKSAGAEEPIALLSMGSKGALAFDGEAVLFAEPIEIEEKSTIGSGDSLLGGLLAGLVGGDSLEEALKQGSAAGAATAMTDGTQIARRGEVQRLLKLAKVQRI